MSVEEIFSEFLKNHCQKRPPLLLGLSGGPDSMALYSLLLAADYPFEVAHVDHGWRRESSAEASFLAEACLKSGIPFHAKRLEPPEDKKNLEDKGRRARLAFFKEVLELRNLKGVLLAHHRDDQAETVLKRLFEGASLPKLKGLAVRAEVEGMVLYRPLLKVTKLTIINWLEEKKIPYFVDPTNEDFHFLRTRLRKELIPSLSAHFGKEIAAPLCRLGEASYELSEFLETLCAPYLSRVETSETGIALDFSIETPQSPFLWKSVLRSFFEKQGISLPQSILESMLGHLQKGNGHKSLRFCGHTVFINRKKIILGRVVNSMVDRERENNI